MIVDTGAIVAAIHDQDQWHTSAERLFTELPKPFLTCESVLSEACHLLDDLPRGCEQVMRLVASGIFRLSFTLADELEPVSQMMKKYHDVPMSLADACLVRMSEINKDSVIFTFDGDFQIYRRNGRERIATVPDLE